MKQVGDTDPAGNWPYHDPADPSVLVVDGYGVSLAVSRGHLILSDGLGRHRRERRLPRAQRTARRIVILGHTGHISLEAIRWCHDTGIALIQLEADGTVLLTSGPHGRDDPRLRRSQAAAATNPHGLVIARQLLTAKLDGQATVLERHKISTTAADRIRALNQHLAEAPDLRACRDLEASAASSYFGAWSATVACTFAERDRPKVPDHWTVFAARGSILNGGGRSPRYAADPINALLNYGYALLEAEASLASRALGLDPGLGIVHADKINRDSFALDLMEPLRPVVEDRVLHMLGERRFKASDLHETPQGGCRLLPELTNELTVMLPVLERSLATTGEAIVNVLAQASPAPIPLRTPLTRTKSREAQTLGERGGKRPTSRPKAPNRTCRNCGVTLYGTARKLCPACWPVARAEYIRQLGKARAKPQGEPKPTTEQLSGGWTFADYQNRILPALANFTLGDLERATGLSNGACSRVRRGLQVPNPRHWAALARLGQVEMRSDLPGDDTCTSGIER